VHLRLRELAVEGAVASHRVIHAEHDFAIIPSTALFHNDFVGGRRTQFTPLGGDSCPDVESRVLGKAVAGAEAGAVSI
jgi:hypothetical protein